MTLWEQFGPKASFTPAPWPSSGVAAPFLIPLPSGEDSTTLRPLALLLPVVVLYAPPTVLVLYLSARHARSHPSLALSVVTAVVTAVLAFALIPSTASNAPCLHGCSSGSSASPRDQAERE